MLLAPNDPYLGKLVRLQRRHPRGASGRVCARKSHLAFQTRNPAGPAGVLTNFRKAIPGLRLFKKDPGDDCPLTPDACP